MHSERARLWFEQAGEEQFLFCRFTQLTVLRLLTTDQIIGKDTKTMSDAWSRFLPGEERNASLHHVTEKAS